MEIKVINLKGLCGYNENIENQQDTCLQIGTYVGLIINFLDSNYTYSSIWRDYIKRQNI